MGTSLQITSFWGIGNFLGPQRFEAHTYIYIIYILGDGFKYFSFYSKNSHFDSDLYFSDRLKPPTSIYICTYSSFFKVTWIDSSNGGHEKAPKRSIMDPNEVTTSRSYNYIMKFLPRSATLYYVDLGPKLSSYVWRAKRLKHVRKEGTKEKQTLKYCWWKKSYTNWDFCEPLSMMG